MVLKHLNDACKDTMNHLQLTHIPVAKAEMLIIADRFPKGLREH